MSKTSQLRLIAVILMLCLYSWKSWAQTQSLSQYIEQIESNSDFVFNYDVEQTDELEAEFSFSGDYSLEKIKAFFETTALEIEVKDSTVILLPMEKKRYKLCGKIESAVDAMPLAFANIYLGNQGTTSDENGAFSLELSAYKNERCQISYLGFEKQSFGLSELANCPKIQLSTNDFLLNNSIVVLSYLKRGIEEGRSYGGLNLDLSLKTKDLNLFRQDFFRTIQNLPGIDSPDDSAVNLNIRGGTADHNLISWEGVTLYDRGHLFGMISSINPFNIERVSVYKSNHAPHLDNKIGGVVQMFLSDKVPERLHGSAGFNLTEGFAQIHLPVIKDKLSLMVAGRKSIFGIWPDAPTYESYTKKVFGSETALENSPHSGASTAEDLEVDFQDFNAKLIVQARSNLKFQSSWFLSSGENRNVSSYTALDLLSSDKISSSNTAYSNRLSWGLASRDSIQLSHSFSSFEEESLISFAAANVNNEILRREESHAIEDQQWKIAYDFGKQQTRTSIGYILDRKSVEVETEDYSTAQTESENKISRSGLFHHFHARQVLARRKLLLELGGRASYSKKLNNVYFSPSISLRYRLSNSIRFKASSGIYHQFIRQVYEPVDNNLNLENAIWQLDTEEGSTVLNARKSAAGFIFRKSGWLLDIEGYYHHTKGLAAQNPNVRNAIVSDSNNQMTSLGVDFLVNKRIGSLSTALCYSLANNSVILLVPEEEEEEEEEDEFESQTFPANNQQLHQLKLMSSYQMRKWEIRLAYQYKTGLPLSKENTLVPDDEDDDEYELEYAAFNNSRLADYHRLDLSILYVEPLGWGNLELGLSMMNLLGRQNQGSRKYLVAETNTAAATPEVLEITKTQLPFTFNTHLRLLW